MNSDRPRNIPLFLCATRKMKRKMVPIDVDDTVSVPLTRVEKLREKAHGGVCHN